MGEQIITSNLSLPSAIQIDSAKFAGKLVASALRVQSSAFFAGQTVFTMRDGSLAAANLVSCQYTYHNNGTAAEFVVQWKNSAGTIYHATLTGSQS